MINLLVENAIVGRSSPALKALFSKIHTNVFGQNAGDSMMLYDKIERSFEVTINELCKDRIMLDALRIHRRQLDDRLEGIEQALANLTSEQKASSSVPSHSELVNLSLKVARALQGAYRTIRIETNKGARSVEITKVYVPSGVRYRDTPANNTKLSSLREIMSLQRETERGLHVDLTKEAIGAAFSYPELRGQFHRVVILGDPGGGKSTLCQYMCFDLSKKAVAGLQSASAQIRAQLQKLPIRVILRNYERAKVTEPQLSIYQYILRDMQHYIHHDSDELQYVLDYILAIGGAILAFDGLDEILVTARRREFVDLVLAFCNQYPLCPVIVTLRIVGYDDASLSTEFDELILDKFSDDQIVDYTTKFMRVVGGHTQSEAGRLAAMFFEQTTRNAADLRRNPLMLGLMAWIFNAQRDVPSNRPEIYRECATLMFERWDFNREIKPEIPADFDRLELFSDLASKIYGDPQLAGGVELPWLEDRVREFFEGVYENKARAVPSAKAVVSFITGRAWVMSDVGDGVFAFTHQTFLEYFFARYLDELYDSVGSLFELLRPKIQQREWDMVSHLALQIKSYRALRKQNETIDFLVGAIRAERDEKARVALTSFAARALEYLAGAEPNVKSLVLLIVGEALSGHAEQDRMMLMHSSNCSLERRPFVSEIITDALVTSYINGQATAVGEFVGYHGTGELRRAPEAIVKQVRTKLQRFILDRIEQSEEFAIRGWEWYGYINQVLVAKYGIPAYYSAKISDGIDGIDGLTSVLLCASDEYNPHYRGGPISQAEALKALSIFGNVGFSGAPWELKSSSDVVYFVPFEVFESTVKSFVSNPKAMVGAFALCIGIFRPAQRGWSGRGS